MKVLAPSGAGVFVLLETLQIICNRDWARAPQRLNCLLLPVERLQFDRFVLILLIYLKFYEKKPGSGSWPLFKACQGKFYNQQQNSNL